MGRPLLAFAATLLLAGAGLAACPPPPDPLPLRPVAQGYHSGIDQPEQRVIRAAAEWSKLWVRHTATSSDKTPPKVDFTKEMVLAAFLGQRSTGGYAVQITDARVAGRKLLVTVQEKRPGRGELRAQLVTSPFCAVAVKASQLPVEWKVTETEGPSGGQRGRGAPGPR